MTPSHDRHVAEENLERYAMHTMAEDESVQVEEHLLLCDPCRQQLEEMEAFIRSMRSAAQEYREEKSSVGTWFGMNPRVLSACAACLVVAVVAVAGFSMRSTPGAAPMAIVLEANRAAVAKTAEPGTPLVLRPEMNGLPAFARYEVEMVDAGGAGVWKGSVDRGGEVRVPGQKAGTYFFRISSAGKLLREYGLQVGQSR